MALQGASSPSALGALQSLAAVAMGTEPSRVFGTGWTVPPAWQINTTPSQDELMEIPCNWPPEFFWLATAFQADKRGICVSMP